MYSTRLAVATLTLWCGVTQAQIFTYVEPNNRACPTIVASSEVSPKTVKMGATLTGAIRVSCGFTDGSYTVILSATDPKATFSPKTFLVNFGSLSGTGTFSVKFATVGEQTISATISSNMGSPVLSGKFMSSTNVVNVVVP